MLFGAAAPPAPAAAPLASFPPLVDAGGALPVGVVAGELGLAAPAELGSVPVGPSILERACAGISLLFRLGLITNSVLNYTS